MGFRIRKTIKILPGVKINLSNSGISTTVGGRGASVNIKRGRKTKTTLSIPGTGLSHTSYSGSNSSKARPVERDRNDDSRPSTSTTNWRDLVILIAVIMGLGLIIRACSN